STHPYERTWGSTAASEGNGSTLYRPSATSTTSSGPGSRIRSQRVPRLTSTCAPSGESIGSPAATVWQVVGGYVRVTSKCAEASGVAIQTWIASSLAKAVHATTAPSPCAVGAGVAARVEVGEAPDNVALQASRARKTTSSAASKDAAHLPRDR